MTVPMTASERERAVREKALRIAVESLPAGDYSDADWRRVNHRSHQFAHYIAGGTRTGQCGPGARTEVS